MGQSVHFAQEDNLSYPLPASETSSRGEIFWRNFFFLVLAFGIILRIVVYVTTHWTIMDGLIGFRFAEQFSQGNGLVFNAGERISGNTSVLYTFLLGIAGFLHLDIPIVSRVLGILFDTLSALAICRITKLHSQLNLPEFRFGIPAAMFIFPLTFPYGVSAMETPLYVFLILLLTERTLAGTDWKFCLVAGLIMFCRPDGVIFVAASLLFLTVLKRRIPWTAGLTVFGIGLCYLGLNAAYYGNPIPNTVLTKAVAYHDSIRENFHYIAGRFLKSDLLLALGLGLAGATVLWFRRTRLVLLLGFYSAGFFLFLITAPHLRSWYVVPLIYLIIWLIALGTARLLEEYVAFARGYVVLAVAICYVIGCGAATKFLIPKLREIHRYEIATRVEPGIWLRENTPPDARVFVTALEVGYYSKRYTIDSPGLVTPAVWHMIKNGSGLDLFGQAQAMKADYALVPAGEHPPENFELIREFKCENPPPSFDLGYELYRRHEVPAN